MKIPKGTFEEILERMLSEFQQEWFQELRISDKISGDIPKRIPGTNPKGFSGRIPMEFRGVPEGIALENPEEIRESWRKSSGKP